MAGYFARMYAIKVQDRVIKAEENLRYFALTGKLLPRELGVKQIVALRFASDEEFVELAERAAKDGVSPIEIKRAVKNWRADTDRV
jgi:transglutaminase-like putative cysteine protease